MMTDTLERDTRRAEAAGYLLDRLRDRPATHCLYQGGYWDQWRACNCTALDALGYGAEVQGERASNQSAVEYFRFRNRSVTYWLREGMKPSRYDAEITDYVDVILAALLFHIPKDDEEAT